MHHMTGINTMRAREPVDKQYSAKLGPSAEWMPASQTWVQAVRLNEVDADDHPDGDRELRVTTTHMRWKWFSDKEQACSQATPEAAAQCGAGGAPS